MERELRNLREKTTIYEEILKETHRSEDRAKQSENRLLSTVHWTLGTAITVTLLAIFAVVGLNWWINEKVYTRDKQALHDEFTKMVKEGIDTQSRNQITTIQTQFTNLKSELLKEQNSSYANAFIQLADIRQSLLDLEGALMNARSEERRVGKECRS